MQTEVKGLVVAEKKIQEAIEIIEEQGIGIGMSVSQAKVLDALIVAHSLIREVIKKN